MNTDSRIEIYDSKNEKTVIQPPAGYEFTGECRQPRQGEYALHQAPDMYAIQVTHDHWSGTWLILRPLPTPKEQRAEKLYQLLWTCDKSTVEEIDAIEAIFTEYPDKKEK